MTSLTSPPGARVGTATAHRAISGACQVADSDPPVVGSMRQASSVARLSQQYNRGC